MMLVKSFDTGEVVLNYAEGPDNGPPMLLIPGFSSNWKAFTRIIPSLSESYHLYSIDLRGTGKSSRTPGEYKLSIFASDVKDFLIRVISEPCILLGHSNGALVSTWCAHLVPTMVSAVILGDDIPTEAARNNEIAWVKQPDVRKMISSWKDLCGRPVDELVGQIRENHPDLDEDLVMVEAESNNQCDPELWTYYVEGRLEEYFEGFSDEFLRGIMCPILLVRADPESGGFFSEEDVETALALNENLQHVFIKGIGHGLGIRDDNEHLFLDAIKPFLESLR